LQTSSPDNPRPGRKPPGLPFRRRLRGESGAAIVEFALVLPLMCLVIVLILDFGRAFNYWIDTTHLAGEGARLAAVDNVPTGSPSLQAYLRSKADTQELRDGTSTWIDTPLQVCVTPGPGDKVGDPVEVSVSTTYHFLRIPVLGSIVGLGAKEIRGRATMRREVLADNVSSGCG
jgi:Flp pilus assembly protein TadG